MDDLVDLHMDHRSMDSLLWNVRLNIYIIVYNLNSIGTEDFLNELFIANDLQR